MDISVSTVEYRYLARLHQEAEKALSTFQTAFSACLAVRDIERADFVSLSPTTLTVKVPEADVPVPPLIGVEG